MMWKEALQTVYIPELEKVVAQIDAYSEEWKDIPMLARTMDNRHHLPDWERK